MHPLCGWEQAVEGSSHADSREVVDGDSPPGDQGVWAVQPVSGAWLWKLFVPDTNLCLRTHLGESGGGR
jgi:hypothetical protein